jgi:hypothetical protein
VKGYDELAQAASNGDELATRIGLEEVLRRLDLDVHGVFKAAEQRAIRCVLAATHDEEKLAEVARAAHEGRYIGLELTEKQKELLPVAQLGIVDGLVMGLLSIVRQPPIEGRHRTGRQE